MSYGSNGHILELLKEFLMYEYPPNTKDSQCGKHFQHTTKKIYQYPAKIINVARYFTNSLIAIYTRYKKNLYILYDCLLEAPEGTCCKLYNENSYRLHQFCKFHNLCSEIGLCHRHRINCTLSKCTTNKIIIKALLLD